MNSNQENIVLELIDGIIFRAGPTAWKVEPLKIHIGESAALVPDGPEPDFDPAGCLCWILATMQEPEQGAVSLMGHDIYQMDFAKRQRLRSKIGFVHGFGGLLSNRTISENIALPISVHGGLTRDEERERVLQILSEFGLSKVARLKPHEMDGATRWRACLARAFALDPTWLILEGLGNWEMDHGRGLEWTRLIERKKTRPMSMAICLSRGNPGFENWFEQNGGRILRYNRYMVKGNEE